MGAPNTRKRKGKSPWLNDHRDPVTFMSTENHMQLFDRLVAAGVAGIHNPPGPPKPKKNSG